MIVLAGDTNRYDLTSALDEFLDIEEADSPPTRNNERLDTAHTNVNEHIISCTSEAPLENDAGTQSDHLLLLFEVSIPHIHSFEWVKYRTRDMKEKNKEAFNKEFIAVDWEGLLSNITCPSEMTEALHRTVTEISDRCLPWRDRKIRSTDDPWITDEIRRAIRQRQRRFAKYRRSHKWQEVKDHTNKLIKESKQNFYANAVEELKAKGGSNVPYRILKDLAVPDRPKAWSINQLAPNLTDVELAEKLAEYFGRITDQFSPLDRTRIPQSFSSPFQILSPCEVATRIRQERRVKSAVEGDIPPSQSGILSDFLAIPATRIFNYSLASGTWPSPWLLETQSAIPKNDAASTFNDLRNLSCTNALSKTLESYVLEKLRKEIKIKTNQFGGVKGSGTCHFLIDCWDNILRALDDPDTAASLLSIDFSKAFNRMDHNVCIHALWRAGASRESLSMVASFLDGRRMKFKVGSAFSREKEVRGGSPQGTKLGNFLFVVTINEIESSTEQPPQRIPQEPTSEESSGDEGELGLLRLAGRVGAVRRFDSGVHCTSTPQKLATADGVLRYLDESGRENSSIQEFEQSMLPEPTGWSDIPPWTIKYVDDVNTGESHFARNCCSVFSQAKERKILRATSCQETYRTIEKNASEIGMLVNPTKTQLLCVSAALHSVTSSYIETGEGNRINSQDSLVLLGFRFGDRPSAAPHVDFISEKFNARVWALRHLKAAGVPTNDIVTVYASTIRSVIEYASVVYHSMLTSSQSDTIEAMQRRCLKIIFGHRKSYATALEETGLDTLKKRRENAVLKFALKAAGNEDFSHWFKHPRRTEHNLRNNPRYAENYARTERLYKSPLFFMRRLLNSQ